MFAYSYAWSQPTLSSDPSGVGPRKGPSGRHPTPADRLNRAQVGDCLVAMGFYLNSVSGGDPALSARYNACVAGSGCPDLSPSMAKCLVTNLCTDTASVTLKKRKGRLCGDSTWLPIIGCPSMTLYSEMLDNPGCDHFGTGAPYHIVLLHEALHTCGVEHQNTPGYSPEKKCNNIMACCMLRAYGLLGPGQKCQTP